MYSFPLIQGTRSNMMENYRTNLSPTFNWRKTINWNVEIVFFQHPWYIWLCWKIVGTTFQCLNLLQSRGQHISRGKFKWSQDLRMELKQQVSITETIFFPNFGSSNTQQSLKKGSLIEQVFCHQQNLWSKKNS